MHQARISQLFGGRPRGGTRDDGEKDAAACPPADAKPLRRRVRRGPVPAAGGGLMRYFGNGGVQPKDAACGAQRGASRRAVAPPTTAAAAAKRQRRPPRPASPLSVPSSPPSSPRPPAAATPPPTSPPRRAGRPLRRSGRTRGRLVVRYREVASDDEDFDAAADDAARARPAPSRARRPPGCAPVPRSPRSRKPRALVTALPCGPPSTMGLLEARRHGRLPRPPAGACTTWAAAHLRSLTPVVRHASVPATATVMPFSVAFNGDASVVAAAGHRGELVLYSGRSPALPPVRGPAAAVTEEGVEAFGLPLVRFTAHSRWISEVQFVRDKFLFTASDDGAVALWDASGNLGAGVEAPLVTAVSRTSFHDGGVYSAHHSAGHLVTGSKDETIGLGRLSPAGFVFDRYVHAHDGVVKCVRWRPHTGPPSMFASCGNDKRVAVHDVRTSASAVAALRDTSVRRTLSGHHDRAVNTVAWHPSAAAPVLLSSGFDTRVLLYDLRHPGRVLHTLHPAASRQTTSKIVHPVFFMAGRLVLTAAPRTNHVVAFCTATGARLHNLPLAFVPTLLQPHDGTAQVAVGQGKYVWRYRARLFVDA